MGEIQFDRNELLGIGKSAGVFRGEFKGQQCAVKRVEQLKVKECEKKFMEKLTDHPHIVKLLYCETVGEFTQYVLELCDASLEKLFLKPDDPKRYNGPPMPHDLQIFHQLALGLEYIHSKNLIHRDIKPHNILISVRGAGQDAEITIKWADFGLSREVKKDGNFSTNGGIVGTEGWEAPEILRPRYRVKNDDGDENQKFQGTVKSDIFALGLVFGYLFLKGGHLYGFNTDTLGIVNNIIDRNPIPNLHKIDGETRKSYADDLLEKMLEDEPRERMTSTEVVTQLESIMKTKGLSFSVRPDDNIKASIIRPGIDVNAEQKTIVNPEDAWNYKQILEIKFDHRALLEGGSCSIVFRGEFKNRPVAVKRVEIHNVNQREEEALLQLDHPNVVKILHCESDRDFRYFALELCDASLYQLFLQSDDPRKYNGPMPRQIEVFRQLAFGLEHIHSKQLIHRDIKPHNILIKRSPSPNEETIIKWADFGWSRPVNEQGTYTLSGVRGTGDWMAPELRKLLANAQSEWEARGTVKSDVFSLGLVFGFLFLKGKHLYGSHPFEIQNNIIGDNPINMQRIDKKERKSYAEDLLEKMLQNDPSQRMTSAEVVQKLNSINENEQSTQQPMGFWVFLSRKKEKSKTTGNHGRNVNIDTLRANISNSTVIDDIRQYIQKEQDLTGKDAYGWNLLHLVCRSHSGQRLIDAIKILVKSEIDVNVLTDGGWNALHLLCRYNSSEKLIDAMTFLIGKEINVKAKAEFGWNALHCLCSNNSSTNLNKAMKLLIDSGIQVNARRNNGWNALHILCRYRSNQYLMDEIKVLVDYGIDVKTTNTRGCNALHYLCSYNSSASLTDALQYLIKLGIDVNARDINRRNALHYLCSHNSRSNLIEAIDLLNEHKIDVKSTDKHGSNALICLCRNNSSTTLTDAIQRLIKYGIDVNVKDSDGCIAIHYLRELNSRKPSQHLRDAIKIIEDESKAQLDGQYEV